MGRCCGCSACYASCPVSAIQMIPDKEGFEYPVIDQGKCTNCGICRSRCPVQAPYDPLIPKEVYAAMALNESVRVESSSGGVFPLVAQHILDQGGVVCGCGWNDSFQAVHKCIESRDNLPDLKKSKYVQSRMGAAFSEVDEYLMRGRLVLFSGTPCQVAGLLHFLGEKPKKLICLDLICREASSPRIWEEYKEEIERKYRSKIQWISFRDKRLGWTNFSLTLKFRNGKVYSKSLYRDPYMQAFLRDLSNRPACYHCPARNLRSHADITLGDYWNISEVFPTMDDKKGTSAVIVNTEEGRAIWDAISRQVLSVPTSFDHICSTNWALKRCPSMNPDRERFWSLVDQRGVLDASRQVLRIKSEVHLYFSKYARKAFRIPGALISRLFSHRPYVDTEK